MVGVYILVFIVLLLLLAVAAAATFICYKDRRYAHIPGPPNER